MNAKQTPLVDLLRLHAEDLHSEHGHNKSARLLSRADKLERWGMQLDDLDLRIRRLRERVLECLCTGKDLTNGEAAEIKRYLGVLKLATPNNDCTDTRATPSEAAK